MTRNTTPTFGTCKSLVLKPPAYMDLKSTPEIAGLYCYVQKHPGENLFSVAYSRSDDGVAMQFGDRDGEPVDLTDGGPVADAAVAFLGEHNRRALGLLSAMKLPRAQLFFTADAVLTDVQVSINKLVGPGMLQELFGKAFRVPETVTIETLDERAMAAVERGAGIYSGDLLLKPSRFRHTELPSGRYTPLYVQVLR